MHYTVLVILIAIVGFVEPPKSALYPMRDLPDSRLLLSNRPPLDKGGLQGGEDLLTNNVLLLQITFKPKSRRQPCAAQGRFTANLMLSFTPVR